MGWLLGCFKCTGILEGKASHRHRQRIKVGSGRPSSAAVAHATSPEDLHNVRRLPTCAVGNGYNERELFDCQAQTKKKDVVQLSPEQNDGRKIDVPNRRRSQKESRLDEELESLRTKLIQEADAAKKLSDEVKYLKACQSLLESPSRSLKVTFDSVISAVPPSPLHGLEEGRSLHNRDSKKDDCGKTLDGSNMLKCAELKLFRVKSGQCDEFEEGFNGSFAPTQAMEERKSRDVLSQLNVPSPPWTFSEAKLDTPSWTYAFSEDLLQEHLDVSSLIEDSVLITNWELSLGEQTVEQGLAHEHTLDSYDIPGQEVSGVGTAEFHFSVTESLQDAEDGGHRFGRLKDGPMDSLKLPWMEGMVSPVGNVTLGSSNFIPTEAEVQPDVLCPGSHTHAPEDKNTIVDIEGWSFQGAFYGDSGGESATQGCFSSQFRISKRIWSSTRKNAFDREASLPSAVAGYWHPDDSDIQKVLLPCEHAEMQLVQARNYDDDTHPLGKKHAAEPMAEPTMLTEQPWLFLDTAKLLAESIEKETDSTPQFVVVEDDAGSRDWSLETGTMKTTLEDLEQGDALVRRDETLSQGTGPMENMKQEGEALARRDEVLNAGTFSAGDLYETQRKRSKLSSSESVALDKTDNNVKHEHEENVCLLDSMHQASHESIPEEEANPSNDQMNSELVGNATLSWPSNESSSNVTSDLSMALSPPSEIRTPFKPVKSHRYHPASLADDRPILGTVAAHWSPLSTARKWWDGKGIPNSTNKYKEDQQVNWHAVPFEVRLEQALAKQDSLLSK